MAERVVERLRGEFGRSVKLEPILWEHEPMRATEHFQEQIPPPSACDIVVCVLWSRLGTRLPKHVSAPGKTGTEWEFEDAARSYREKQIPDLLVYRKKKEPLASLRDEPGYEEKRKQLKALDAFVRRWFESEDGTFKAAFKAFEKLDQFEDMLERDLRKLILERLKRSPMPERTWHGDPFRGLEAFDGEHAPIFFGRTRAIGAVREALAGQAARGCAFVLVFGMSGVGKSSLVRAGVLPTITRPGVIEGIGLWRWCVFRPGDAAGDLCDGLAAALTSPPALPELKAAGVGERELAGLLREAPGQAAIPLRVGLRRAAEAAAAAEHLIRLPESRLALVVDQMEELFSAEREGGQRAGFVQALSALARSGLVWVIATMRSDFYPRCAEVPELAALKEGAGQYDLLPPTAPEIHQMISYPARAAGLRFEEKETGESLDGVLQEAATRDPQALPLLEFTLAELYKLRTEQGVLTFAAYDQLGGMEGALARRAEEEFAKLSPPAQAALPAVFRALVTVRHGEEGSVATQAAPRSVFEAAPGQNAMVEAFIRARLLVTDRTSTGAVVVRMAHEALLRRWPRLERWLAEDRDFLRVRARVAAEADRWRSEGELPDYLLPEGKPLAEAEDLLRRRRADLDRELVRFIDASRRHHAAARRRRLKVIGTAAAAFLAVVSGFGLFSFVQWREAEKQRQRADIQRDLARKGQQAAQRSAKVAEQRRREADKAKRLEGEQRRKAEAALERNRILLWYNSIGRAERAWLANNLGVARQHLDECPKELRSWEWDYLRALCYGDLLTIPQQHAAYHAAFNHDGSLVACASAAPDGKDGVCLYDSESGKRVRSFSGHTGPVGLVRFSPDGRLAVSMSRERGEIKVWDPSTAKVRHSLPMREVGDVAFSPDGSLLAAGGDVSPQGDGQKRAEIRIWRVDTGEPAAAWPGPKSPIASLAFSPDGKRLVSGGGYLRKGEVKVWDVAGRKEILSFDRHSASVFAVACSPDGKRIATGGYDHMIYLWDAETGGILFTLGGHRSAISCLAFSHDPKHPLLASASWDQSAKVWDVGTGQEMYTLRGHDQLGTSVAFDREDQRLVTTSRDRTVKVWSADRGSQRVEMAAADSIWITSLAFHPRGRRLAAAARLGDTVVLWQPNMGVPYGGTREGRNCMAYSSDGKLLAAAVEEKDQHVVKVYDAENNAALLTLPGFRGEIASVAFSPDDKLLATACRDGVARLWEVSHGKLRSSLERHKLAVTSVVFTPDSKRLVTASYDRSVRLWDVKDGRQLRALSGLPWPVMQVAVSRDGKHLAAALGEYDKPGEVWVWDLDKIDQGGTPLRLRGHNDWVTCVAFHPQGKRLASGSYDKTVKIWDLTSGLEAFTLQDFVSEVTALAFAPEGRRLAVGERGGKITVFFASSPQD
jgi:WD40 repeat protein